MMFTRQEDEIIDRIYVEQLLSVLNNDEVDLIFLFLAGYSVREVSRILEIPPSTCGVRYSNLLERLRPMAQFDDAAERLEEKMKQANERKARLKTCTICGFTAKNRTGLSSHVRAAHPRLPGGQVAPPSR